VEERDWRQGERRDQGGVKQHTITEKKPWKHSRAEDRKVWGLKGKSEQITSSQPIATDQGRSRNGEEQVPESRIMGKSRNYP